MTTANPPPLLALLAVIACISITGLSMGLTIPLISLRLEMQGVDTLAIGLMAAAPALAILVTAPWVPALVAHMGGRGALLVGLGLAAGCLVAMAHSHHYGLWLGLRLLLGAATGVLFTVAETWINRLAPPARRGRWVGIYATVFSLCLAAGPALLTWFDAFAGSPATPFWLAAGLCLAAALPLVALPGEPRGEAPAETRGLLDFIRRRRLWCAAVGLFAALDAVALALFPLFGLRHGFEPAAAAGMATALVAGNVLFQLPIGWLADRLDVEALLRRASGLLALGAAALPAAVALDKSLVWPLLLVVGAAAGGLYTLVLIGVGHHHRGAELVTANAAIALVWGLANWLGPLVASAAMALLDPDGLSYSLALGAGLLWLAAKTPGRRPRQ
ncbi:MAG: MFS transporter [Candidatus Competibacterales bacterium]